MQAKVIRKEESLLEFDIGGENHTFLGTLREVLKDQEGVLFAAYRFPHPLLENPIFYLRTSESDPVEALQKAAESINQKCDELTKLVKKKISD
ncbi:MAG: RpoL/Rpb11 RNA polymerase subunit family protein [Candidatus Hodarchaeales archaeon]